MDHCKQDDDWSLVVGVQWVGVKGGCGGGQYILDIAHLSCQNYGHDNMTAAAAAAAVDGRGEGQTRAGQGQGGKGGASKGRKEGRAEG